MASFSYARWHQFPGCVAPLLPVALLIAACSPSPGPNAGPPIPPDAAVNDAAFHPTDAAAACPFPSMPESLPDAASTPPTAPEAGLSTVTRTLVLRNQCVQPIWPAATRVSRDQAEEALGGGFWAAIAPGGERTTAVTTIDINSLFGLIIWGRTACTFGSDGNGACLTGDCDGFICRSAAPPSDATTVQITDSYTASSYGSVAYNVGVRVTTTSRTVNDGGVPPAECASPWECRVDLATACNPTRDTATENACGEIVACAPGCDAGASICHPPTYPPPLCPSSVAAACDPLTADITFCP